MIVSHLHRFIFVKTHKTAGTSMEIALSGHCGPNDIITRLSPDDEKYRQELGSPGPQNDVIRLRRHPPRRLAKALRHLQHDRFHNHMPATTIRGHVGGSVWDSYFKFTIERNPFDRAVSRYWYSTQGLEPRPV